MALSKQKSSTLPYSLSLFKDSELKLESELKLGLSLLSVLGTIGAGIYQTSINHKRDT